MVQIAAVVTGNAVDLTTLDAMVERLRLTAERCKARGDRREVFIFAYHYLTNRLRENLLAGRFVDVPWTRDLAVRFADLYFDAEAAFDRGETCSLPWHRFFVACTAKHATALELLMLGMNAHIVYDLPLALEPGLTLDPATLARRQFDHDLVNEILEEAIDPFQEMLARNYGRWIAAVDWLAWRVDEWAIDQILRATRNQVWRHAVALAASETRESREVVRSHLETIALRNVVKIDLVSHVPRPVQRLLRAFRPAF
ncbi:MAG: hypothetical protein H0T79_03060 [Deltaproteobacteria bacterium]|nr:hypothetical protein [Deltaproteobacteria bacterium]